MSSEQRVTLAHGNGGRFMRELISEVFAHHFKTDTTSAQLDTDADAVSLSLPDGIPMVSTDGFTVKPLEFPGGNIGSLAIHGTVNDLSVAGARPLHLTVNAFIEEGLEFETLHRLIGSMAEAAREANITIVAGDTKVVPRGEGSGLYLATTGIGVRDPNLNLGMNLIQPGDKLLVSGPVGDHGTAVMLAREAFGLSGDLQSDSANVYPLTSALSGHSALRFMRDPTRGGLATVCHEINRNTGYSVRLNESELPLRDPVRAVCEMLGYDPLYLACEGRVVAVAAAEGSDQLLSEWQALEQGKEAAIIGEIAEAGPVILQTELGGERYIEELEDEPLPRIC
ncbi:hydrogenase expression/formation protein HypE [Solemya pervernicosa gill symbiont]|uniref:Hydrogenase expression/formation protein HypE n=1 Tax=Solemya pervernicosa gill symbiont TaxID=642797 RepID=A0A1T2L5X1_9GAMM|nr:hydrogenase expression/formation protein HypE [Solemya pervernicosa gill symbiont]OOZ40489.1 hydrogenase expression/formation protein HypE [Solemya pervernicosa gill symbiont]